MKRRKNIIISAITCMFSVCLMMFGVYAAVSPTITLSGQVSYTVRDAKVLVLGKVNGQSGEDSNVAYPTVADMTNPTVSEKVTESTTQYMSFTKGDGNSETDQLDTWNLSTHTFYEDNTGIRPITISMKLSNLSNYPVLATVAYTVSDATLATGNLTRTTTGLSESTVYLPMSSTKEISITYDVLDDSKSVSGTNLVGMTVTFAKTVEPTASNAYYTNAEGTSQELTLSDWEYIFEGDSYTITKYKGTLQAGDLYIPSSITTSDNKTYPVKALGAVDMTVEEFMDDYNDIEIVANDSLLYNLEEIFNMTSEDQQEFLTLLQNVNVVIPEGVEKIRSNALASVPIQSLPASIKYLGVAALNGYFNEEFEIHSLTTVELPNVEIIDACAFYFNVNLTSVTLGDKLESIGMGAFGATGLTNITIPSSVESIGDQAFAYCTGLTSITIPSSVTSIGEKAFGGCSSLTTVQVNGTTPCACGETIFGSVDDLASGFTIYVPDESYKTATNWETYKDYMNVVELANQTVQIGDWQAKLYEDNTATLLKYTGDLNKETLTIPATLSYEGTTYNVKSVGVSSSDYSDDDLLFVKRVDDSEELNYSFYQTIALFYFFVHDDTFEPVGNGFGAGVSQSMESYGYAVPKFKNVIIQDGIQAIDGLFLIGCYTLENISIPQSVHTIGVAAFWGCENLQSVSLPNKLVTIGEYAFSCCTSLTNIIIPSNVTSIGSEAFQDCSRLTSIIIPSKVKSIGTRAFRYCNRLSEVINLSSLSITAGSTDNGYVGYYAVRVAKSGTSAITITEDGYKFLTGDDGNNYLVDYTGTATEVTLPTNGSYKIHTGALFDCADLTSLTLSEAVTDIGSSAFSGCTGLTNIIIPQTVASISDWTFSGCSGLISITIPSTVTSIGDYAFTDCTGLTSITIENGVTSIGAWAFKNCTGLTSITIPNSVPSIREHIVAGCSSLISITFESDIPPTIETYAFTGSASLTAIYVPSGSVEAYKSAFSSYGYESMIQAKD